MGIYEEVEPRDEQERNLLRLINSVHGVQESYQRLLETPNGDDSRFWRDRVLAEEELTQSRNIAQANLARMVGMVGAVRDL